MGVSVVVDVHCDTCGEWVHGAYGKSMSKKLLTEAIRDVRRRGWQMAGSRFACAACVRIKKEGTKQ